MTIFSLETIDNASASTALEPVHVLGARGSIGVSSATCPTLPPLALSASESEALDAVPFDFFAFPQVSNPTPISVPRLALLLEGYPVEMSAFLVNGFSYGFHIGFQSDPPSGPVRNNKSAFSQPDAVSSSILKELRRGHTAGPFKTHPSVAYITHLWVLLLRRMEHSVLF